MAGCVWPRLSSLAPTAQHVQADTPRNRLTPDAVPTKVPNKTGRRYQELTLRVRNYLRATPRNGSVALLLALSSTPYPLFGNDGADTRGAAARDRIGTSRHRKFGAVGRHCSEDLR